MDVHASSSADEQTSPSHLTSDPDQDQVDISLPKISEYITSFCKFFPWDGTISLKVLIGHINQNFETAPFHNGP